MFRPTARPALVGPAEQCERCPEQDQQIGLPVVVADVPEVELDALRPGQRCATVDLGPPRDPGPDVETVQLALVVAFHLVTKGRSWADHGHVTANNVPELWQFVDADPTQDATDLRDPGVPLVDGISRS